ncbi:hypothetical protein FB157_120106 [Streptomyces sp. BK340]|nr:hypothetical protein FB157_120106 [Streptomyces sp. BK340]
MRVREAPTDLATALPPFTSPVVHMFALPCTLRAVAHGLISSAGLLRSIRPRGHTEIWVEMFH